VSLSIRPVFDEWMAAIDLTILLKGVPENGERHNAIMTVVGMMGGQRILATMVVNLSSDLGFTYTESILARD